MWYVRNQQSQFPLDLIDTKDFRADCSQPQSMTLYSRGFLRVNWIMECFAGTLLPTLSLTMKILDSEMFPLCELDYGVPVLKVLGNPGRGCAVEKT